MKQFCRVFLPAVSVLVYSTEFDYWISYFNLFCIMYQRRSAIMKWLSMHCVIFYNKNVFIFFNMKQQKLNIYTTSCIFCCSFKKVGLFIMITFLTTLTATFYLNFYFTLTLTLLPLKQTSFYHYFQIYNLYSKNQKALIASDCLNFQLKVLPCRY